MLLSAHFTLAELTRSQTAIRLDVENTPNAATIERLRALCDKVLEPIRIALGPIVVSSGYRSTVLNRMIGSIDSSQHVKGEAADIESVWHDNLATARWIAASDLPFDQLILEFYKAGDRRAGWVHVSHASENRRQVLTAVKTQFGVRYLKGLPEAKV